MTDLIKIFGPSIAALTSIIVAVISFRSSKKNQSDTAKQSKEIEKIKQSFAQELENFRHSHSMELEEFKHSLELKRKMEEQKVQEKMKSLDSLSNMIKSIQMLKDALQRILESFGESLYSEEAVNTIKAAGENLIECFEVHEVRFTSEERAIAHTTKNKVFGIDSIVINGLKNTKWASSLTAEHKIKLKGLRKQLSEAQERLRDFRFERSEGTLYEKKNDLTESQSRQPEKFEKKIDRQKMKTLFSRVLVVEDDKGLLDHLIFSLQKLTSMKISPAQSFETAVKKMETQEFDLVITDYELPGGKGTKLINMIRNNSINSDVPIPNSLPIIIMSGLRQDELDGYPTDDTHTHYLPKPSPLMELGSLIYNALKKTS